MDRDLNGSSQLYFGKRKQAQEAAIVLGIKYVGFSESNAPHFFSQSRIKIAT
jgi:hypothetical protein